MPAIQLLLPTSARRRWHLVVAERLRDAGHKVGVEFAPVERRGSRLIDALVRLEAVSGSCGLAADVARADFAAFMVSFSDPDLVVDLAGAGTRSNTPRLLLTADGKPGLTGVPNAFLEGRIADLTVMLDDGTVVATAAPMVDSRARLANAMGDVAARAVSLIVKAVATVLGPDGPRAVAPRPLPIHAPGRAILSMLGGLGPRIADDIVYRARFRRWHWRVGWRFLDGPGVAERGSLSGEPWHVMEDDGTRFYADPFPFEHRGRHSIFVEDYAHHIGKGVISVAEFGADGRPGRPCTVIEEPFHLSYPQVFAHGGEIYMIPESGAGRRVMLYRAVDFPGRFEPYVELVRDRELFDATLLEHGGRFWLFATERDGWGSASDMLVVWHADRLEGPWKPHAKNPILIDRANARPGGGFRKVGDRIVRPVQDGTESYGGGLGLSDVLRLDEREVVVTRPAAILPSEGWAHPRIHTLNRHGRLEVIDGLADVSRWGGAKKEAA